MTAELTQSLSASDIKYVVEEENVALVRAIGRPRSVLDVGCGVGLNGLAARRKGARVTGIEIVEATRARAKERLDEVLGIDITSDDAVRQGLSGRTFDLMLFADVLEHVPDPQSVLRRLLPFLEDDGHVIVSLPNVAAWPVRLDLMRGRFEYTKSGILDDTHLRFFTRETGQRMLEDAGLEVLRVEQNPMVVRAAKNLVLSATSSLGTTTEDPESLRKSLPYKLYQGLVRPVEDVVAARAPELLAFQHVYVARKPVRARKLRLTVGMLTMNEKESVAAMIGEIRRVAPDAQILCVDSSKDETPEIAARLGARVLRQVPPRGHGPAMELLMYNAAAQSDLLIYLDCDFTYPADYIPILRKMVEEEGIDVINCARTRTRPAAMPMPNYIANRAFAAMAHAMHGVPTCDVHSGMRAYRSSVIRAFDFDGEGDAIPIDTLLFPAKCGYRVVEMPIDYHERVGQSKLRKLAGTVWTMIRLVGALPVGSRGAPGYDVR
ncbi:MAG: methyltransferase domain-containing protein [Polyangiaceae bacterium]|nr:methyltransferase domain-containing protein [Polyangiaceae bacterium]